MRETRGAGVGVFYLAEDPPTYGDDEGGDVGWVAMLPAGGAGALRPFRRSVGGTLTGATNAMVERWSPAAWDGPPSEGHLVQTHPDHIHTDLVKPAVFASKAEAEQAIRRCIGLREAYIDHAVVPASVQRTQANGRTPPWPGADPGLLRLGYAAPATALRDKSEAQQLAEEQKQAAVIDAARAKYEVALKELRALERDAPGAAAAPPPDDEEEKLPHIQTRRTAKGEKRYRARHQGEVSSWGSLEQAQEWLHLGSRPMTADVSIPLRSTPSRLAPVRSAPARSALFKVASVRSAPTSTA